MSRIQFVTSVFTSLTICLFCGCSDWPYGEDALVRVKMPSASDRSGLLSFGKTLSELPSDGLYVFDFSDVKFTSPQWMLLTAIALRKFKREWPGARRKAVHFRHLTYAAHMGYFRYVGMDFGKAPDEAPGSRTYVPITPLRTAAILDKATESWRHHGDVIEERANKLARVLTQLKDGPIFDAVAYSVREIVRNVVEHSGAHEYSFVAQYWPTKSTAEILVADEGIGITKSLLENPNLQGITDEQAITAAILPGISSKAWMRRRDSDVWANSGYGLFMTSRLCALGDGEFCLLSGNKALSARSDNTEILDTAFGGTAVSLKLDTSALPELHDALSEFRKEGARLAKQVGGGTKRGPSMSSLGLKPSSSK